jgi:hypothetical protein
VMIDLPLEIVYLILQFCQRIEWKDKCLRILFPHLRYLLYNEKVDWITKHFNDRMLVLFGGIDKMIDYPIIKFERNFQWKYSNTNYIDNIKPHHMEATIMIGIDFYHRGFIAIKSGIGCKSKVKIIFQRLAVSKNNIFSSNKKYKLSEHDSIIINNGKVFKQLYGETVNVFEL